jgi:hypothetical protein
MKKLLILLLLVCNLKSFAQKDSFEFKLIDTVNATKAELYLRARQFVALNFNDAKSVIQMDDKDAGKIICKGVMDVYIKGPMGKSSGNYIDFTINVDIKENKYRVILSNFNHDGLILSESSNEKGGNLNNDESSCQIPKKFWDKIKDQTKIQSLDFLAKMKVAMEIAGKDDNF